MIDRRTGSGGSSPPDDGREFVLECGACGKLAPALALATLSPCCGRPQLVRYDTSGLGPDVALRWRGRAPGLWRYREILPLRSDEEPVTLGEGGTPLVETPHISANLDVRLLVKDEGRNPTGSFKDRGLSAAVTRAAHDGASAFVIPTAGNAGVALAAYGARAGLPVRTYVPRDTPPTVAARIAAFGAERIDVDGLITDCGALAVEYAAATGAFDVSTLREPYRIEGKKTMAIEIAEAMGWQAPDAVVYPTGGGTGLIGTWKALGELREMGLLRAGATRLYVVQAEGCAPLVRAWERGLADAPEWDAPTTVAWGLRVPRARGDFLVLRALRETAGGAIAVPDAAMEAGASEMREREGIPAGIEGGACLAAVRRLREGGEIAAGETVVLFNTGNLQNY